MVGRRIGPYELTARIGGGGMGTVYRATRVEDFRQEVAVKLIERGMDSDAIVRRFHAEIHVQAALGKHPNIAGLLDAGTTEDGRPLLRDGVRRRPADRRVLRRPSAGCPGAAAPLRPGLRRGPVRPPARGDPPRPEAGPHPGHVGRGAEADRTSGSPS